MTRERAVIVAELEASTATAAIAVYRLPAWPADVYGVRAADNLPREALTFETFQPLVLAAPVTPCGTAEPVKIPKKTSRTLSSPQGSLF